MQWGNINEKTGVAEALFFHFTNGTL